MFGATLHAGEWTAPAEGSLQVGSLELNRTRHVAALGGTEIALSRSEFLLLAALMERPGEKLSRLSLAEAIWGERLAAAGRPVDQHVYRLRLKLARASQAVGIPAPAIEVIQNFGYRLVGDLPASQTQTQDA
jgi:DNA-binding response OmpR family regulator